MSEIKIEEKKFPGIIIKIEEEGKVIALCRLYYLNNDFHEKPFAFIEYTWVDETHRRKGVGSKLYEEMIRLAKEKGCYKMVACSRLSREGIHGFIQRQGFKKHGYEFRLDLE